MKALLVLALVGFAPLANAKNDCFNNRNVNGYKLVDEDTITVKSFRKTYVVKTHMCHELKWAHQVAFESFGSSSQVCRGDKLIVADAFGRVAARCRIDSVTLQQ